VRCSARLFTLLSALSVARLARRRMVGFDGAGALSLARFSTGAKDSDSRSPAFRILQRFAALSPVAGDH